MKTNNIKINNVLIAQTSTQDINEKPLYSVIFDNGKPYTEVFNTAEDLKQGLKDFYDRQDKEDYFTAEVFNQEGEEITESQFINEMVGDFLND